MAPQPNYDEVDILDIQQQRSSTPLLDDLRGTLRAGQGKEKQFPTILLYDERGLKLFEEITFLDEYYLTNAEIEVLKAYSDSIAEAVPSGVQMIELGSGYAIVSCKPKPRSDDLAASREDTL
jgi:L-histidine Nalpha-methyltransferase / hercynylcysteine S-oxide synthase